MEKLSVKDKIGLATSGIALVLSIVAFVNSEIKGASEKQRTMRSQLTDVLSRIISLNLENAKNFRDAGKSEPIYYQQVSSILNQQNAFLLQQAMYVAEQIPGLVTTAELNTIAVANANAGDLVVAETYHKRAIDAAPTDYYKALAMRSYAIFLFPQRRFEEGRELFRNAVTLLKGGDNLVRWTNGQTYQMWGYNEMLIGSTEQTIEDLFLKAQKEFSGIDNQFMRDNLLKGLDASRKTLPPVSALPNQSLQPIP